MFLGHFGLAFAAKRVAPEVSVGTAILAAQFLDVLWPVLVIAGVERVAIAPGITRMTPLDFTHYPWSHSLAMTLVWAASFAAVYWIARRRALAAIVLAALVASHWLLDWVVHRPDLPLYPGDPSAHGLGVWDSVAGSLALEALLFAAGAWLYARSTRERDRTGAIAWWALVAFLAIVYLASVFGPPPPSAEAVAYSALVGYALVAWGWWIDRHREPRRAYA